MTAASSSQIPETAEAILTILEAIRAMEIDEEQYLPQDATASVLRALRLNQAEQLKAIPMLQKDSGVTISEMKEFTEKRHADYTMWVRTFAQTEKDYKARSSSLELVLRRAERWEATSLARNPRVEEEEKRREEV